jgi:hypothetical protein
VGNKFQNTIETYKNINYLINIKKMVTPIEQAAVQEFASYNSVIDQSQIIDALSGIIQPLMGQLSFLVGGIFGLYLIFIIGRLYYEHKKVKLLRNILYDLDKSNMHHGIRYSKERKNIVQKTISKIKAIFKK